MDGSLSPFATSGKQVTRRNLESWCLNLMVPAAPVILLTFDQDMDQTDKPGVGDFEGEDSDGAPITVTSTAWEAANILRVHMTITFESTLDWFRYLGPLPSLKTLTGEIENAFTLTTFPECGAKMLEDLKTHDPKKPYPPWSATV